MASGSVFGQVILFFDRLGIYDVVLPFLLTFTIMFAILERTRVLGIEKVDDVELTKKNLNAMVAFVIAFLVVASSRMVAIINDAMPNIVMLVLVSISFLMLAYTFYGENDELKLSDGWRNFMMGVMFIGVAAVFAHAIPYKGRPWLEYAWDYVLGNYASTGLGSIIMMILLIGIVVWVTKDEGSSGK